MVEVLIEEMSRSDRSRPKDYETSRGRRCTANKTNKTTLQKSARRSLLKKGLTGPTLLEMSGYATNQALEPRCPGRYIAAMSSPRLSSLAAVFLQHGNMTFGGGSATIATLHREIITKRDWVTQRQFDLSYALSRLTPGTNLLAFSTAIGWFLRGWSGALVVLLASSLACSVLAVMLTVVYESWSRHPFAMIGLHGALAAAVGIVAATAWTLVRPHVKEGSKLNIAAFAIGAFLLAAVLHIPPIRILLLAALVGVVLPQGKEK